MLVIRYKKNNLSVHISTLLQKKTVDFGHWGSDFDRRSLGATVRKLACRARTRNTTPPLLPFTDFPNLSSISEKRVPECTKWAQCTKWYDNSPQI